MTLSIRRGADRGHANHGWLDTHHSFSFASYYDPAHMGFRSLRVINEDRVAGGAGFGAHPHRDMEIITYVLEGALEHKDSMGNGSVMRPGDVQRMSAGTGVTHSEFNHHADRPVHLLQIWIEPAERGMAPSYEQRTFDEAARRNQLRLVASPTGVSDSLTVHQDARLYASLLEPANQVEHELAPGRHAWLQVARGEVEVSGHRLIAGDGAFTSDPGVLRIGATAPAELLLFDLS